MKAKTDEDTRKLLILIRFDSLNLFKRIKNRFNEYLKIFSMKRTRTHFEEIFGNQFKDIPLVNLTVCSEEVLIALNNFYEEVDELYYYLKSTEEMGNTVKDTVKKFIREIEPLYGTLKLYLEGELGYLEVAEQITSNDDSKEGDDDSFSADLPEEFQNDNLNEIR